MNAKTDTAVVGEPLRVVLVGAGRMGAHHARAIAALQNRAALVGVVDSSRAARDSILKDSPGTLGGANLRPLAEEVQPDVVHVCTPMEAHAAVAEQALDLGAHVYVEKPVALSLEQLNPLLETAKQRNLKLCAGHQVLFERPSLRLRELLPQLGTPVHIESFFSFRPVRTSATGGRPLTNGEQLVDVLPHPVYLLIDLLERIDPAAPLEISALELSHEGTVHALVRKGGTSASLVVTLEGRPVSHWLRVVGTNGTVEADFVRSSVLELLGPGASGIDKAVNPFRLSFQMGTRTVGALGRRVLKRGGSYPGLEAIFSSFYRSILEDDESPTSADQIRGTVAICAQVAEMLERKTTPGGDLEQGQEPTALVTGGTGLLGREVVKALLAAGESVLVAARRPPSDKQRVPGARYMAVDLATGLDVARLRGIRTVVHCAAETAGGWEAHQRNSVDATERLLRAAAEASVRTFVHVSSVAVLDAGASGIVRDDSPLHRDPKSLGPYVWGKHESERLAAELAPQLGLDLRIVRPAPLVDWANYQPPGRLGRRVANLYVAVGSPREKLVIADTASTARAIVAVALRPHEYPEAMNLVPAKPPKRRELVDRLRQVSPEVSVVWLPRPVLHPLSWLAVLAQKALRPRKQAVRLASAFATQRFEPGPAAEVMEGANDGQNV